MYDGEGEFSVTLNGQPLTEVIWADEEEGKAEIFEHEWNLERRGARIFDPGAPLGYRTLNVQGEIRIHPKQPPPLTSEQMAFSDFSDSGSYPP